MCSEKCVCFCRKSVCCWCFFVFFFGCFKSDLTWCSPAFLMTVRFQLIFHLSTLGLTIFHHHNYFLPPLSPSLKSPCLISRPAIIPVFVFSAFNAPSGLVLFWADRDFLRLKSISSFGIDSICVSVSPSVFKLRQLFIFLCCYSVYCFSSHFFSA